MFSKSLKSLLCLKLRIADSLLVRLLKIVFRAIVCSVIVSVNCFKVLTEIPYTEVPLSMWHGQLLIG
jgi:hypothetical protein